MLVIWGGRTIRGTSIYQVSEMEKGKKENDSRTVRGRNNMADPDRESGLEVYWPTEELQKRY